MRYTSLLVGAHFRPPAKQILAHIPAGAGLSVEAEPDNPYDPGAIRVWIDPGFIPASQYPALETELPNGGTTLEAVLAGGPVWLGYVAGQSGKPLLKARAGGEPELIGNQQLAELGDWTRFQFQLGFGADGTPRLVVETEPG